MISKLFYFLCAVCLLAGIGFMISAFIFFNTQNKQQMDSSVQLLICFLLGTVIFFYMGNQSSKSELKKENQLSNNQPQIIQQTIIQGSQNNPDRKSWNEIYDEGQRKADERKMELMQTEEGKKILKREEKNKEQIINGMFSLIGKLIDSKVNSEQPKRLNDPYDIRRIGRR